jgi:hypothetical protein
LKAQYLFFAAASPLTYTKNDHECREYVRASNVSFVRSHQEMATDSCRIVIFVTLGHIHRPKIPLPIVYIHQPRGDRCIVVQTYLCSHGWSISVALPIDASNSSKVDVASPCKQRRYRYALTCQTDKHIRGPSNRCVRLKVSMLSSYIEENMTWVGMWCDRSKACPCVILES